MMRPTAKHHLSRRHFLRSAAALPLATSPGLRASAAGSPADYQFSGPIPETVLHKYLARTLSMRGFWQWKQFTSGDALAQYNDNLRMIRNLSPKQVTFVGDLWWDLSTTSYDVERVLQWTAAIAADLHAIDPQIIVGGTCFETIGPAAGQVPIPSWVFDEMDEPRETRNFRWDRMKFPDNRVSDGNPATPAIDVTQLESRLWYYYWARRYIDAGCEHFDMGELSTISQSDRSGYSHCFALVARIRAYAARNARRKWILISAQTGPMDSNGNASWTGTYGVADKDGKLLLDYLYGTTRARENPSSPQDCVLARYADTIFGRTRGGIAPSGWPCERTPYTLNLDPGVSPKPGTPVGWPYQWGCSEPGWFANQSVAYRADWLRYANAWLAVTDPYGFLAMSGQVTLGASMPGIDWYHANSTWYKGPVSGLQWFKGFDDENVIKEIWSGSSGPALLNGDFSRPMLDSSQPDWVAPEIPSWTFGSPTPVYSPPNNSPLPSGQTANSMSGIARSGSIYAGSVVLDADQQVAFLLGTGSISQTLAFPGGQPFALQFIAAQRTTGDATDQQELLVSLNDVVVWRDTPSSSFTTYRVDLGAPEGRVHVLKVAGASGVGDVALIMGMRVVPAENA